MKGDFTRSTFNRKKHYSGVRMQQGRVQLDADWNEQVDIESYRDETTTADVVGATGVPVLPDGTSSGFQIQLPGGNAIEPTMNIRQGRIYVDGILCENEEDALYTAQPDYRNPPTATTGLNVVYLDVWQRHITAIDDPAIQEVALGGPDTATRVKTMWQVKYLNVDSTPGTSCRTVFPEWDALIAPATGKLGVKTAPPSGTSSDDPCIVPPAAGYRGLENQYYRVEIHRVSGSTVTYKWSRDNGAFLFAAEQITSGASPTVTVKSLGRDQNSGLRVNDWIEIRDLAGELAGVPGTLAKITEIDTVDRVLTLQLESGGSLAGYNASTGGVTVRRWDFTGTVPATLTISGNVASAWIPLEHGIEVQFTPDSADGAAAFRAGQYWTFAARTATQDVEWPTSSGTPVPQLAEGIEHHYARLAVVNRVNNGWDRATLKDCRPTFLSLAGIPTIAFHFVGGDGQETQRGAALPQLLQVAVTERGHRVAGARVKFTVKMGNGRVKTTRIVSGVATDFTGPEVIAETDIEGVASAEFTLDSVTLAQQVEAVLLDELDLPRNLNPIRFNATFNSSGTDFAYVSGDGQEGLPGDTLPRPLQVGVNELGQVQAGVHVRFKVVAGGGTLSTKKIVSGTLTTVTGSEVIAVTGTDGVASADLELDATRNQQVEARLLDANDQLRNITPIYFNASIDSNREFLYVGGDGQEALPGGTLPAPLQVGVVDGERKVQGAKVRFTVMNGTGQIFTTALPNASQLIVETGADGVASCNWTLDTLNGAQQVEANLLDEDENVLSFTPVRFNATIGLAKNIGYMAPTGCEKFTTATTVQAALDALCACDCAPDCPPVIRITGIFLGTDAGEVGPPIHPYSTLTVDSLRNGLMVQTDTQVDSESIKPCTTYAEAHMPYPLGPDERTWWGLDALVGSQPMSTQVFGTKPMMMPAVPSVDLTDNTIIKWEPSDLVMDKLDEMLGIVLTDDSYNVPIKFYLKGPSIWAEGDTSRVLAGNTKYPGNVPQFPSGEDCEHGSDFIFCFTIIKNPPVDVPCEKITAVTFDQPVIIGSDIHGTVYLERATGDSTTRTFKVTSDSNSVIPSNQVVTVGPGLDRATFTLETSTNPITTTTPVKLTFENSDASDPCKQNFTTVLNVDPIPCDQIRSITLNDTVIGDQITGTVAYRNSVVEAHTLTVVTDNDRLPGGQTISVPSTNTGIAAITLQTDSTPVTPVTTPVVVITHVTDPCGNVIDVPVTIKPVPCIKIKSITINPCQGGSPALVTVDFYEPIKVARALTFTTSNGAVVDTGGITAPLNATTVSFYLTTHVVDQETAVTLTVNDCNEVLHPEVIIRPKPCEDLAYFDFDANPIGGSAITGHVQLRTTAVENRTINFQIDVNHTGVIDAGQSVVIRTTDGTSMVPFSLTSHVVNEPTDVVVTVVLCGKTYHRFITIYPVPCEPPTVLRFDKNPIVGGTVQTGQIILESPSYTANTPVVIQSSNAAYMAPFEVAVTKNQQTIPFSFTMPAVDATTNVEFRAVRPCGETSWVTVNVQHPTTESPRIRSVVIGSPEVPAYTYPFTTPTATPSVNLARFAMGAGPTYNVRVTVEFCGVMPDTATINSDTFKIYRLGETSTGTGIVLPGSIQVDTVHHRITCDVPSSAMFTGNHYRIVLKGATPGSVMAASGEALRGSFDRDFNGTNCSGGESPSDFRGEFVTVYLPNQMT